MDGPPYFRAHRASVLMAQIGPHSMARRMRPVSFAARRSAHKLLVSTTIEVSD